MIIITEEKSEDGNFIIAETTEPFYVGSILCDMVSYHCQAMEFRVGNKHCGRPLKKEDYDNPIIDSLAKEIYEYLWPSEDPACSI